MPLLDSIAAPHTLRLFGVALSLGPNVLASLIGWVLFGTGALLAVRERMGAARAARLSPLVSAALTLAAISAGLGLLLADGYPTFTRIFCFPYALLALAVAVFGRALQAGERPLGEE
jgi:hypothetical protein